MFIKKKMFLENPYIVPGLLSTDFRPFGNLGIGISASASALASTLASALQKFYFCLTKCFMKNYVKYTQIFFLALTYAALVSFCYNYSFTRITYHISTEIPGKTSIVESFSRISAGLPGSLSYVDLLFCREQVSTCFCRKDSTGDRRLHRRLHRRRLKVVVCRAV